MSNECPFHIRATHDYGAPAPGLTRFTITEKSA